MRNVAAATQVPLTRGSALPPLQKLQNEPVRLRTVELGGPVHYADQGGRGPTLVMLHGLGGCYLNWGGLVSLAQAALAKETVAGLVLVSPAQLPSLGTRLDPVQASSRRGRTGCVSPPC